MGDQHPLQPQQGSAAQHLPQRPSKKARPQPQKKSPHQNQPQHPGGAFPSPHSLNNGLPLQHHSPFPNPSPNSQNPYPNPSPNGHPAYPNPSQTGQQHPDVYYNGSPYGAPVSGHYSASETPDVMAATHMQQQRQPYPVYHTPQSNSPASVTSSQGHDQHAARMYSQPPQMHNGMYYQQPQMPYGQSPYSQHTNQPMPQQHQMMASQPGMPQAGMPHPQGPPPMPHPQHSQHPAPPQGMTNSPRPQTKIDTGLQQRSTETAGIQRAPTAPASSHPNTPAGPAPNGSNTQQGQGQGQGQGGPGANPNAAPGPIPATTPLVVRQDNNGVQWIAFEYSRDRVKMEYTIRCDVESVNVDALDVAFKDDNCVYPRACGPKETYRGNRIVYETECNTVGWSLAELNPCLRGKRGLIQRAVDSWRNSNSDSKLRSRRVRRLNKVNVRSKNPGSHPNQVAGPQRDVGGGPPPNGLPAQIQQQQQQQRPPPPPNMNMGNAAPMHHHHAHPDAVNPEGQLVNGDFKPQPSQSPAMSQQIRQAHVVQGYPNYPTHPTTASMPSMPPQMYNGMDTHHMPPHPSNTIPASTSARASQPPNSATTDPASSPDKKPSSLLPDIEPRKRKFILVEDTERNNKVRVRVNLEGVDIAEIPDSYREANSVYPRSYFPTQMQLSPRSKRERRGMGRFADPGQQGVEIESRTQVKLPVVEGGEVEMPAPRLSRAVGEKEERLNDLGYRMSWSQSRTFAGRVIFLQRSLDAYRNKMKTNLTGGKEENVAEVPPLFETRIGKRTWVEQTAGEARTQSPRIKSLKH